MDSRVIAKRNADATIRIRAAAQTLAEQRGLDAPDLAISDRLGGPEVARLKEREALADFLEALASSAAPSEAGEDEQRIEVPPEIELKPRRKPKEPE